MSVWFFFFYLHKIQDHIRLQPLDSASSLHRRHTCKQNRTHRINVSIAAWSCTSLGLYNKPFPLSHFALIFCKCKCIINQKQNHNPLIVIKHRMFNKIRSNSLVAAFRIKNNKKQIIADNKHKSKQTNYADVQCLYKCVALKYCTRLVWWWCVCLCVCPSLLFTKDK